jgi:shikimate 5-dehydrogenase
MLVGQGAAAFTLWTGREAPRAVMLAAAQQALANDATR